MNALKFSLLFVGVGVFFLLMPRYTIAQMQQTSPRIINIVNFIRQTDYRVQHADSLLFDATEKQVALMKHYKFPGTFLLQYDALINPKYQQLLKEKLGSDSEIGAWWEITQPHVEAAGIAWRGRHRWVSTANIAFTTGYTPQEREKLVDVYMVKFKEIFGTYPKSVASWFIDAHSLAYMHEKYGIVASANCKDQVGTDGYTLWGGYWNQTYYPSRKNAYMPAQNKESQIPVPIFRMLGSDPIYQYDKGVGTTGQGVISLEPVYRDGWMDRRWTTFFLDAIVNRPSLAFNYAQAGQENSFTWKEMRAGLEMQFPLLDSLRRAKRIRIETLAQSGTWFKSQFATTPATAVTAVEDYRDQGNKSVWYNSRYYRANLFWESDAFRFRDIHLFDEDLASDYLAQPGTGGQFFYYTIPVVDGFFWSTKEERAGLRIVQTNQRGERLELNLANPEIIEKSRDVLEVCGTDHQDNVFVITLKEGSIDVVRKSGKTNLKWSLALYVPAARQSELPFDSSTAKQIRGRFKGHAFQLKLQRGTLRQDKVGGVVFNIEPSRDKITLITKK
ncbi:hypothetical protein GCM10017764_14170 [Sphingobacterium griseoflavum]|uniref:Glycoside hydrolase family 42 N-terminal domain-containing protein n=2 Tax=Sphingobacterium griseoflavum TaxID=1474952 RepID=A0ABQ3HW38_9SPHI|nr:hypothetical protein GCM10017764_14170 [Sphingobacterium griseoflavum]